MEIVLAAKPTGSEPQLIIAALIGIAVIVTLITWLKVHPFLALGPRPPVPSRREAA